MWTSRISLLNPAFILRPKIGDTLYHIHTGVSCACFACVSRVHAAMMYEANMHFCMAKLKSLSCSIHPAAAAAAALSCESHHPRHRHPGSYSYVMHAILQNQQHSSLYMRRALLCSQRRSLRTPTNITHYSSSRKLTARLLLSWMQCTHLLSTLRSLGPAASRENLS